MLDGSLHAGRPSPGGLAALRKTLDAVPSTPPRAYAARPAPPTKPVLVDAASGNVWAVPRPHALALSRAQWRGLLCFALALGCLWYLDMLTTAWALQHGGVEGGPVAKFLVSHDMLPLLVAKTVGLGLIILLAALQISRKKETMARWSLGAVGAISLGIVEWNLLGILALAGVIQ